MKVSIIIPVYNVSSYVDSCLRSVALQTYRNCEVVLVDDCGSDDSIERVCSFIENNKLDWKVVRHNRNRGLSAARNTGLQHCSGEYVYFLDSDDEIEPDSIEKLVTPINQNKVYDFVIGGYSKVGEVVATPRLELATGGYYDNAEILRLYAEGKWYMMAWNKLCRKDFLLKHDLLFEEGLIHEDVLWSFKLACRAESMYVVNEPTYKYTIRANSIMTAARIDKDAKEYVRVFSLMSEYAKGDSKLWNDKSVYSIVEGRKSTMLFSLLSKGRKDLYKLLYPEVVNTCYITVWQALNNRIIGIKYLLRDFHYVLPVSLGRMYKSLFYVIVYKMLGISLDGTLW